MLSYTVTTFINKYEQLADILKQCFKVVKDDGYMLVADFSYVNIEKEDFDLMGMYTSLPEGKAPSDFEIFNFIIQPSPDTKYEIFNIPPYLMFRAGHAAGANNIHHLAQYPDPEYSQDKAVRKYLDTCNPSDYLIKFSRDKV